MSMETTQTETNGSETVTPRPSREASRLAALLHWGQEGNDVGDPRILTTDFLDHHAGELTGRPDLATRFQELEAVASRLLEGGILGSPPSTPAELPRSRPDRRGPRVDVSE